MQQWQQEKKSCMWFVEAANGRTSITHSSSRSEHCYSCVHACASCRTLLLALLEKKAIAASKSASEPRDDHPSAC